MALGMKLVLSLTLICLSLLVLAQATVFNVGDGDGWTYYVQDWPKGKSFKAGDVLVFKYGQGAHNVVVVDAAGYNSCQPAPGSKVYESSDDHITLVKGDNYFLCSFPDHCMDGMKIAVKAL